MFYHEAKTKKKLLREKHNIQIFIRKNKYIWAKNKNNEIVVCHDLWVKKRKKKIDGRNKRREKLIEMMWWKIENQKEKWDQREVSNITTCVQVAHVTKFFF